MSSSSSSSSSFPDDESGASSYPEDESVVNDVVDESAGANVEEAAAGAAAAAAITGEGAVAHAGAGAAADEGAEATANVHNAVAAAAVSPAAADAPAPALSGFSDEQLLAILTERIHGRGGELPVPLQQQRQIQQQRPQQQLPPQVQPQQQFPPLVQPHAVKTATAAAGSVDAATGPLTAVTTPTPPPPGAPFEAGGGGGGIGSSNSSLTSLHDHPPPPVAMVRTQAAASSGIPRAARPGRKSSIGTGASSTASTGAHPRSHPDGGPAGPYPAANTGFPPQWGGQQQPVPPYWGAQFPPPPHAGAAAEGGDVPAGGGAAGHYPYPYHPQMYPPPQQQVPWGQFPPPPQEGTTPTSMQQQHGYPPHYPMHPQMMVPPQSQSQPQTQAQPQQQSQNSLLRRRESNNGPSPLEGGGAVISTPNNQGERAEQRSGSFYDKYGKGGSSRAKAAGGFVTRAVFGTAGRLWRLAFRRNPISTTTPAAVTPREGIAPPGSSVAAAKRSCFGLKRSSAPSTPRAATAPASAKKKMVPSSKDKFLFFLVGVALLADFALQYLAGNAALENGPDANGSGGGSGGGRAFSQETDRSEIRKERDRKAFESSEIITTDKKTGDPIWKLNDKYQKRERMGVWNPEQNNGYGKNKDGGGDRSVDAQQWKVGGGGDGGGGGGGLAALEEATEADAPSFQREDAKAVAAGFESKRVSNGKEVYAAPEACAASDITAIQQSGMSPAMLCKRKPYKQLCTFTKLTTGPLDPRWLDDFPLEIADIRKGTGSKWSFVGVVVGDKCADGFDRHLRYPDDADAVRGDHVEMVGGVSEGDDGGGGGGSAAEEGTSAQRVAALDAVLKNPRLLCTSPPTGADQYSPSSKWGLVNAGKSGIEIDADGPRSLDAYVERHGLKDAVKDAVIINVGGNDVLAVDGGLATLARTRYVQFQYHWQDAWETRSLRVLLLSMKDVGLTCYWRGSEGKLWRVTGCWQQFYKYHHWSYLVCANRILAPKLARRMEDTFLKTIGMKSVGE